MSFDSKRIEFSREHFNLVEIDLDYCSNTFGVAPCVGGVRAITTTAVSVDDFTVGDEIEGGTSGAKGNITNIAGTAPTYTFQYRITNGIDFQTAAETITNNTATGVATKNGSAPTLITSGDDKCFNTRESTQDEINYTVATTTGEQTITIAAAGKTFTRSAGSYLTDGFKVGHTVTSSGSTNVINNQSALLISALTATVMTFSTAVGLVDETGDGDEVIILNSIKTYRFCDPRSPLPTNLPSGSGDPDVIPSLSDVNVTASKIDLTGGLGQRTSASFNFTDNPHSDIDVDKYISERSWAGLSALERGTFWTKLRARNPNYQFRDIRHLSGYLNDDGSFDSANFQTRHYVIENLNATNGQATIAAKDPLKLVMRKKALVPLLNTGQLTANLAAGVTTATLKPAGVGNSEYDDDGSLVIKDEVMTFTRAADVLTLVRGQRNTSDIAHNINDTVQQCYVKNAQVNIIVQDLLENFANFDSNLIPTAAWQSEIDTFLSGLLDGIITKPRDVFKVLKELSDAMPHYLWWDERTQFVNLTALKAPPLSADILDMDENLVADSFKTKDLPNMRRSAIVVNFGQFDPTKRLDEPGNWEQSYIRIDQASITKYQSNQILTINSRWISNTNKAAALQLAALKGRRFSDIPREINFSLDAKDSDVWIGQSRDINHRDILDFTGIPVDTTFQITSARETDNYDYVGLEFTYGDELPEDEGGADPDVDLVIFGSDLRNVNLRTVYDTLFPAPDASTKAKFVIDVGVVIGSASILTDGIDTGSWPAGATVTLQINSTGFSVGAGGLAGGNGGVAINLSNDLEIINNGVIGGGGGGGGDDVDGDYEAGGGGGAGDKVGSGKFSTISPPSTGTTINGSNGTLTDGSTGGTAIGTVSAIAGDGADLGEDGVSASQAAGIAGLAIKKNGFVLTETVTGDIRGVIS